MIWNDPNVAGQAMLIGPRLTDEMAFMLRAGEVEPVLTALALRDDGIKDRGNRSSMDVMVSDRPAPSFTPKLGRCPQCFGERMIWWIGDLGKPALCMGCLGRGVTAR